MWLKLWSPVWQLCWLVLVTTSTSTTSTSTLSSSGCEDSLRQPPDAADHRQSDHHPQLRRVGSVLKLNGCCRLMKCSRWNISLLWAEHENEYIEMKERPAGFGCANSLFCTCGKPHRSSTPAGAELFYWQIFLLYRAVVSPAEFNSCAAACKESSIFTSVCPTLTSMSCLLNTELQFCTLNRNTRITQTNDKLTL